MSETHAAPPAAKDAAIDPRLRDALDALRGERPVDAAELLDALLAAEPAEPLTLILRARAARLDHDFDTAEDWLAQARTMLGDHPQLVAELGYLALASGNGAGAVRYFEQLSGLLPGHPDAHFNLALAYRTRGRYAATLVSLERALSLDIDVPSETLAELGRVLMLTRRSDEASKQLERALQLNPSCPYALTASGALAAGRGDFDAAREQFQAALEVDPDHAEAWLQLANTRRTRSADEAEVQAMRARLMASGTRRVEKEKLHFALGKAMDDCGDHAAAFTHFAAANQLRHERLPPYDAQRQEQVTDMLIELCDDEFLRRAAVAGSGDAPLFVVGLPRSGATLLELSLASHSAVAMGGELPYFEKTAHMRITPWPDALRRLETELADSIASEYLNILRAIDADARVTNRHPANVMHLGLIAALLPDATLVHCARDPLDACLSIFFADSPPSPFYAHRLEDVAHYVLQSRRLMAHWDDLLGDRLLRISYEDFVVDPEAGVRSLLAHADLPFEEACTRPHEADEVVATASAWQVRQPIHIGSCERWRHYAAHLESVAAILGVELQ